LAKRAKYVILSRKKRKDVISLQTETRKPIRPEIILLIIAILSATLLVVTVVLSLPYMLQEQEEDASVVSESLIRYPQPAEEETVPPTTPEERPPLANPYDRNDFQYIDNYLKLQYGDSITAIDVSAYQEDIDWQKVADSGVEMAIIRAAFRGWGEKGVIKVDEYVHKNLQGADEVGLTVGVYFFSQATSVEEVDEEIDILLDIIKDHNITGYVVFDWEYVSEEARTANMDARTLTDCSLHFCKRVEEAGYVPMVYFNTYQGINLLELEELKAYDFWLARYTDRMNFPYRVRMWQYTDSGEVPGIKGKVDINVFFPEA
jgi:GH25 family lysozyme M1 (1,4-beta-N-acetylmuramidase)